MRDRDWAPVWCPPIEGARTQMSETRQKAGSGSGGVESPRRRRSEAERRRIVAESYRSGESASAVARRHGVHTSVLFRWRRRYRTAADPGAGFVPLVVEAPEPAAHRANSKWPQEPTPFAIDDAFHWNANLLEATVPSCCSSPSGPSWSGRTVAALKRIAPDERSVIQIDRDS